MYCLLPVGYLCLFLCSFFFFSLSCPVEYLAERGYSLVLINRGRSYWDGKRKHGEEETTRGPHPYVTSSSAVSCAPKSVLLFLPHARQSSSAVGFRCTYTGRWLSITATGSHSFSHALRFWWLSQCSSARGVAMYALVCTSGTQ